MTKELLISLGLSEDQATKVLAAHTQAINGNYIPKHRFDERMTEIEGLKAQVTERENQIKDLKKFEGTSQELTNKIKALEEANTKTTQELETKLTVERKRNAIKLELLADAEGKPYDAEMVLGLFDLNKIETEVVGESVKIKDGFKAQRDALRKDKAFLFETVTPPNPNPAPTPGFNPLGKTPNPGNPNPAPVDASIDFGKSLASTKLGMLGVQPKPTKTE